MDFFISEFAHTYSYDLSLMTTSFYRLLFPGIVYFLDQASLTNSGYDVLTNNDHYTLYLSVLLTYVLMNDVNGRYTMYLSIDDE